MSVACFPPILSSILFSRCMHIRATLINRLHSLSGCGVSWDIPSGALGVSQAAAEVSLDRDVYYKRVANWGGG